MPFDYSDLDAPEIALLALEHLRAHGQWLDGLSEAEEMDQVARTLSAAAAQVREIADDVEMRIQDHFEDLPDVSEQQERLRRPPELREPNLEDISTMDLVEAATSEQEETYQFFMSEAEEVDDEWLADLFREIADTVRRVVIYLEEEREQLLDDYGGDTG